jgi:small conductance mechanosensitive channel
VQRFARAPFRVTCGEMPRLILVRRGGWNFAIVGLLTAEKLGKIGRYESSMSPCAQAGTGVATIQCTTPRRTFVSFPVPPTPVSVKREVMSWNEVLESISSTLSSWLDAFVSALPNLAVALLVVVAGVFVARGVEALSNRGLGKAGVARSASRVLSKLAYVAAIIGAVIIALGVLDLQQTVTSILAGAGVIGLAVGLAFQDIASNLLAGMSMSFRKPFRIGDLVETNDLLGHVLQVDLRTTSIETLNGNTIVIPNNDVYSNPITNYTKQQKQRVDVEVGVSYADDLGKVHAATLEVLAALECRMEDGPTEVFFTGFGGSSIDLVARFWVSSGSRRGLLSAKSEAIQAIKRRYDEEGFTIPFPIRTMDFGIVGGERLSTMLEPLTEHSSETNSSMQH